MPFFNLYDTLPKEIVPGYKASFVNTDNVTMAFSEVRAGAPLPEHFH
jgi:hypothetical protein